MKPKFLNVALTGLFLLVGCLSNVANATLIVSTTNPADWRESTVVRAGGSGTWPTALLIAAGDLPADGTGPEADTYTITPTPAFGGVIHSAGLVLGVPGFFSNSGVHFFRTTFELLSLQPTRVTLAVDNSVQVFINGQEAAREVDASLVNWSFAPPGFPAFDILSDGTVTNEIKFDDVFNISPLIVGTNEVVLAVRNFGGPPAPPGDSGGIAFRMDTLTSTVPEPSTLAILVLGILGLGLCSPKK